MTKRTTTLRPQPWSWPGPRVLLEQPFDAQTQARIDALRRAGFAVSVCPGPAPDDRCPLAVDDGCAAAEGADVVVSNLDFDTAEGREALAALRARMPRLPLVVASEPIEPDELVARVRAELEREVDDVA